MARIGRLFYDIGGDTRRLEADLQHAVHLVRDSGAKISRQGVSFLASFDQALNPTKQLGHELKTLERAGKSSSDIMAVYGDQIKVATARARAHGQAIPPIVQRYEALGKQTMFTRDKIERMGRTLTRVAAIAVAAAAAAFTALSYKAIQLGVDAVESENLFSVSMGKMSTAARAWSEDLSKSLGLNQFELRKSIGTFNVMLTAMGFGGQQAFEMASGLTQLTHDFASFYNLKPEEAFLKLQSSISGEVEPLRRLGILVDETTVKTYAYSAGIADQGSKLTQQQKVLARYGVIMEQTSAAQGDLARTADAPANAMRRLGSRVTEIETQLGMTFLPTLTAVTGMLNDFSSSINTSQGALKTMAGFISVPAQEIMALGLAASLATVQFLEMQQTVVTGALLMAKVYPSSPLAVAGKAAEIAQPLLEAALAAARQSALAFAGGLEKVKTALDKMGEASGETTKKVKDEAKGHEEAAAGAKKHADEALRAYKAERGLEEAWVKLIDAAADRWDRMRAKVAETLGLQKEIEALTKKAELPTAPRSTVLDDLSGKSFQERMKEALEPGITVKLSAPAKQVRDEWRQQISTIVTDWSRGMAEMITSGQSFSEQLVGMFRQTANSILRMLLEALFQPFQKWLTQTLGGAFGGVFGRGTAGAGAVPGIVGGLGPSVSSALGATGAGASALPAMEAGIESGIAGVSTASQQSFLGLSGTAGAAAQAGAMTGGSMLVSDAWRRGSPIEGAAGGAAMGAGIGTMIMPGIGTAIGAGIGAAAGAIIGLFGGGEKARTEERERRLRVQERYMQDIPTSISRVGAFGMEGEYDVESDLVGNIRASRRQSPRQLYIAPGAIVIKQINPEDLEPVKAKIVKFVSEAVMKGSGQIGDDIGWAAGTP